jgi:hypothetical protein
MTNFRDSNGLVAGLIPADTACPFLSRCKFKVHTCPGAENGTKPNNFSCAAARAFSLATEADKEKPGAGNELRKVVERDVTLFEIRKKHVHITFSGMKAVKGDGK